MYTGVSFLGPSLTGSLFTVVSAAVCSLLVESSGSYSSGFVSRSGSEAVFDAASTSASVHELCTFSRTFLKLSIFLLDIQ